MAFIPAPLTARLVPIFRLPNNQIAVNTLHVVSGDGWSLNALELLCETYADWYVELLDQLTSNNVALIGIDARDMSTQNGNVFNYVPAAPLVGAATGNVLPSNITACISFKTGLAGRSYNGRVFHIGLTEPMVTGDYVSPTTIDLIRDVYEDFGEILDGLEWQHVVVSYINNGAPRTVAARTPVTDYVVRTTRVASQRRRLPQFWA